VHHHSQRLVPGSQGHGDGQCRGALRFSWYALRQGESAYRPLAGSGTLGPDLARDLQPVWATLEEHAERIERLMGQQAGVRLELAGCDDTPALRLNVPVAGSGRTLRVLLEGPRVTYQVECGGELTALDPGEPRVDRGVYLLLAELAAD